MLRVFRFMLVAIALIAAPMAHAADKPPTPKEAPARVPFSAFRIKPILDFHSSDAEPAPDAKKPAPKSKGKPKAKIVRVTPQKATEEEAEKEAIKAAEKPQAPVQSPVPPTKPELVEAPARERVPDSQPVQDAQDDNLPIITPEGVPLPGRKPQSYAALPHEPSLFERILAQPAAAERPRPPQVEDAPQEQAQTSEDADAEADADAGVETPDTPQLGPAIHTDRIRDDSRFDEDARTAGSGFGIARTRAVNVAALGLPHDLRNLNLGGGAVNGEISPVLLPGHTETIAAPDAPKVTQEGVPADVVVFFQEVSPQMEVGQIDVVNSDVVAALQQDPDLKLEIVGYSETLDQGPDATKKLAETRALELRDYLLDQHISRSRLTVTVKGDDTKVDPRDRVEMIFSR